MKICYLTRSLKYEIGGLDRYSFEVISRMSKEKDVEVSVLVEQSTKKSYEIEVLKASANSPWAIFSNALAIRKYIKNCEVIHALDLFPYGLIAAIANVGLRKRLFINGVGTESVVKLDHLLLGPVLKWVYRSAEKVLCISEYTKKRILEKAPDLKNLDVVYLGVDYEKFGVISQSDVTEAFRLPSSARTTWRSKDLRYIKKHVGEFILIGVGQPKRRKGYHIAIQALGRLKEKYSNFVYYIVGSQAISKYIEQLKKLALDSGIGENVEFLENISDEKLILLYHSADVFLLPSVNIGQHFEGFGLVFLEAAAAGLPGIGTRDCGIEEAVIDGETGLLVPQRDVDETAKAIDDLLSDEEKRKKMGRAAQEFAKKMDWSITVENYLKYYEKSV